MVDGMKSMALHTVALASAFAVGAVVGRPLVDRLMTMLRPGGKFSGINKPTAGARSQRDLPVGKHPIQLYSCATPNGQKVTCALEEMGIKYDAWFINIFDGDQFTSGFVDVNPNSKIPAMIDQDGPTGKPIKLFESGSILLHLAMKTGKMIPEAVDDRVEMMNWLFFQVGEAPYFGQFGHFFKYAPTKIPYAIQRYMTEVQRALDVLDKHLAGKTYLVAEMFTIADIAWFTWVRCIDHGYHAADLIQLGNYKSVAAWSERIASKPSVQKGLRINSSGDDGIKEYHA